MKKYDVYGIGNAIVDIVTEVDNDFFVKNNVEKGVMTLVDEKRQLELMQAIDMKKSKMTGGGSAANTVVAVNQFGGKSFYSLLVANDDFGKFFLDDLKFNGVDANLKFEDCPQGHTGRGLEAMKKAKRIAEQNKVDVALTFSDPSMVKYFSKQMEEIVGASVDLLFCNDEEALIFTGTSSISEARQQLKKVAKRFVITLGANGALIYDGDTFVNIEPYRVEAVDTNGAGDMFSGAFLYGITHQHSFAEAGKLASLASSKVVAQFGPRLETAQVESVLSELKQH
jgi:sugar/nucleoside kinase (ribokinase family)